MVFTTDNFPKSGGFPNHPEAFLRGILDYDGKEFGTDSCFSTESESSAEPWFRDCGTREGTRERERSDSSGRASEEQVVSGQR